MKNDGSFIGRQVGNYHIETEIARKEFVHVYQGRHTIFTDRLVVIKFFDAPHLSEQDAQRFATAVRTCERLKHPFILPLIDAGVYEAQRFVVTAYAPNGSLRTYLSRLKGQPASHQEALHILSQIGQALQAAHHQQVPHGNLKPENILFDAQNAACLTDFSLLTAFRSTRASQGGASFGRLLYLAPEQLQGATTVQSDQYALGCIAYELLTGSPPLLIAESAELNAQGEMQTGRPAPFHVDQLPSHMEEALLKALEREPARRHVSVFALLAALGASIQLQPASPPFQAIPTTSSTVSSPMPHSVATHLSARDRPEASRSHSKGATTPAPPASPLGHPRTIARGKMTAEQLIREGNAYLESWHYQEALSSFGQAIERDTKAAGAYSGKGNVLWKLDRPEEALGAYEEALRLDLNCAAASCGMGWILCGQKRYEEALTAFEQALRSNATYYEAYTGKRSALNHLGCDKEARAPSMTLLALCQQKQSSLPPDAYYAQSLALQHLDRRDEAMQSLEQCIYRYPGYLDAYEWLGWIYFAREEYESELAVWERALLVNAECANFHVRKASVLSHLERYREALDACDQALRLDPASSRAYYTKGDAFLQLHLYEEALQALNQAIQLAPTFVAAYAGKTQALTDLQRHEEALATYDQVIGLTADEWHYYWQKAELLARLARYEDAIATYDQFIEFHPHEHDGYLWKLFFLNDYELYEEGLATCERWLTANPHHAPAYWWKGRMLTHLNCHEEALTAFDEASRVDPKDHVVYLSKARALGSLKRYEEALHAYDQAIGAAPKKEKIEAYREKAKFLEWLKRHEEALTVSQHIIRLAPKDASAHYQRGEILCHLERNEEALEAYTRAVQLNSKFGQAYTAKGKILSSLERYEEALEMSEKALQLDRNDAVAYFLQEKVLKALGREEEAKAAHKRWFDLFLSAARSHIEESNARYERKRQKRRAVQ